MLQTGQADFLQAAIINKYTADIVLLIEAKDWEGAAKVTSRPLFPLGLV